MVIAGIPLRAPLKPIFTNPVEKEIIYDTDVSYFNAYQRRSQNSFYIGVSSGSQEAKATFKCNYTSVRQAPLTIRRVSLLVQVM
uniref:Uncharacterized protein n=1 Tax=Salix viminalis TaxID=40686 RepID=A0A6N2L8C9_SALVM